MTFSSSASALAAFASAAVLTSCSLLPGTAPAADLPVHALRTPSELTRTQASLSYSRMLPGSPSRPALIAGRSAEPSGPDRPTVWRSSRGTAWEQVPVSPPVDGELVDLAADADDSVAVLAGTSWQGGRRTAWALESSDGVRWSEVALPDGVPANPAVIGVVVLGGAPLVVVAAPDGGWHAVSTGPDAGVTPLPDVPDDVTRRAAALDAVGNRIALVANRGDAAGAPVPVAYVSPDGGRTWNEPVPVGDTTTGVTGLTTDGTGFVATGWVRASPEARLRPTAWRSADGGRWTPESLDLSEVTGVDDADLTLTSPAGGYAAITVEGAPQLAVARRVGNRWEPFGFTERAQAITPSAALGVAGDRVVVAMSGRDAGLIGSLSTAGTWVQHASNGDPVDRPSLWRVRATGSASALSVVTSVQTVTATATGRWPRQQRLALDADGVGGPARPVPGPQDPYFLVEATDDAVGDSVTLVPGEPGQDPVPWTAWHSAGVASAPTSSTLPTAGGDWVVDAVTGGGGWVAVGETKDRLRFGARAAPAAWASPDGRTWTQVDLPRPEGLVSGSLDAVCPAPDGSVLAVGTGSAGGTDVPLAYRGSVDGGWSLLDTSALGRRATLGDCAGTDGSVGVLGSAGGRDRVWEVDADGGFTTVRTTSPTGAFHDLVDTPAGLAVVGTALERDWAGGVLEVRTSASAWTQVRVPAPPAEYAVVGVSGGRIHTYWQTTTGVRGYGVDLTDLEGDRRAP